MNALPARISRKILLEPCPEPGLSGDCWAWTGHRNKKGYGVAVDGKGSSRGAHRVLYEMVVGPVPSGMELDHRCVNRPCVNPDHLEPVTHQENIARSVARRTHCAKMHPLSGDNLMVCNRGTARRCRACYLEHARQHELRRRQEMEQRGGKPRRRRRVLEEAAS